MTDLFDFQAKPSHFGVMGNPVKHSKSPQIHQLFAQQFAIQLHYDKIQVDVGGFAQAVSHFFAHGGAGLNVTLPFKVEAWQMCSNAGNELSARARCAQAVNTLRFERNPGQVIIGDNTDGVGMVRDIERNLGFPIRGKRVLVLGAGGAVRGMLGPLADCNPATITIANRTAHKARTLAEYFGEGAGKNDDNDGKKGDGSDPADHDTCHAISGCGYEQLHSADPFDLIINGTSASLDGEVPDLDARCLNADSMVYDIMYARSLLVSKDSKGCTPRAPTAFARWASANGAGAVSDGLGMLVEQAAESFYQWHNQRPDTAPVINALRWV